MSKIEELKKQRFEFLNTLYEQTAGNYNASVDMWVLGPELGFTKEQTQTIVQYLEGEHLIEYRAMGGWIAITHYGVKEVENAISHPEIPTNYFPPVNIINVQHMQGSQIQQGTISSSQITTLNQQATKELLDFLMELRNKKSNLNLVPDDASELSADIDTVESQLKSSKPKMSIISESLKSIRSILEGATGSILASEFLLKLPHFLGK